MNRPESSSSNYTTCQQSCVYPEVVETEPLVRTQAHPTGYGDAARKQGNGFNPPVKSHIFAAKGAARGVRLINLRSLLAYVNGLANTQPKKGAPKKRGRAK